jgi:hypothetical protein
MTSSATPGESSEPATSRPGQLPSDRSAPLQVLAAVARALASLPADADDVALIETLGLVLIPGYADLCLLHAADSNGQLHLVGMAPPAMAHQRQVVTALDEQGALMVIYEPLVDDEQPVLMSVQRLPGADDEETAEHRAFLGAAGLCWELVVPLHSGSAIDALLVIDRATGQHGGDAEGGDTLQLAAVLSALVSSWRAAREWRIREETLHSRLDVAAYAGRELAHSLNNSLTMPVGVIELLLDRNTLPSDLQEMVHAAASDLASLEQHIRSFQEQMRAHSSGRPRAEVGLPPS